MAENCECKTQRSEHFNMVHLFAPSLDLPRKLRTHKTHFKRDTDADHLFSSRKAHIITFQNVE